MIALSSMKASDIGSEPEVLKTVKKKQKRKLEPLTETKDIMRNTH